MQADIITDPYTVMIELIAAPIAPLAMFGILQNMCIANITVKLIVFLVEVPSRHPILLGYLMETFKSYGWICGVARCHFGRRDYHCEKTQAVAD